MRADKTRPVGRSCRENKRHKSPARPASPTDRFIIQEAETDQEVVLTDQTDGIDGHEMALELLKPRIYLETSVWPLSSPSEVVLFRHFVHKLAIWASLIHTSAHHRD